MHFRIAAPEGNPRERVLLLSSPMISTFHWRKIVPELTQMGCLVVLADLPGFGRSDCSAAVPQDSVMRANILWGMLDEIDRETGVPDSMWHLAGHGSACAAILEMGALYPDSVKSQVHIAPLFSVTAPREEDPVLWYRQSILEKENFRRMIEHCSAYPMDDYIIDRMRAPLLRPGARQNFLRMLRAGQRECECSLGFCPAMAILGGRDALMRQAELDSIRSHLEGAEMHTLKSAGHFPMETHSKALRDYLRGWIQYNAQEA